MKFSEEQIERVSALRTALEDQLTAFESGFNYGERIYFCEKHSERPDYPTWMTELHDEISKLMIEEMKIGETDISEFNEMDFYISLGEYFGRIDALLKRVEEKCLPYFFSIVNVYRQKVIEALKK